MRICEIDCNYEGAWIRHKRRGEKPCTTSKVAKNKAQARRENKNVPHHDLRCTRCGWFTSAQGCKNCEQAA